jgi:hypothetical protein
VQDDRSELPGQQRVGVVLRVRHVRTADHDLGAGPAERHPVRGVLVVRPRVEPRLPVGAVGHVHPVALLLVAEQGGVPVGGDRRLLHPRQDLPDVRGLRRRPGQDDPLAGGEGQRHSVPRHRLGLEAAVPVGDLDDLELLAGQGQLHAVAHDGPAAGRRAGPPHRAVGEVHVDGERARRGRREAEVRPELHLGHPELPQVLEGGPVAEDECLVDRREPSGLVLLAVRDSLRVEHRLDLVGGGNRGLRLRCGGTRSEEPDEADGSEHGRGQQSTQEDDEPSPGRGHGRRLKQAGTRRGGR